MSFRALSMTTSESENVLKTDKQRSSTANAGYMNIYLLVLLGVFGWIYSVIGMVHEVEPKNVH